MTSRREAPPQQRLLRLPGGYYDPDSAAFDDDRPSGLDELLASTSPAEPAAVAGPARS